MGSTLDLFNTVSSLAGVEGIGRTDGHDLSDTLLSGAPGPRESMAFYRGGELRAFRHGAYKLHLITEGAYGQPPARTEHDSPLLYHLGEDPAERFDIAAREPEVVKRILAEIDRHRSEVPVAAPLFDRRLE